MDPGTQLDSFEINRTLLPNSFFWYLSVIVILAVHVIAVIWRTALFCSGPVTSRLPGAASTRGWSR